MEILPFCTSQTPFYEPPTRWLPDSDLRVTMPATWLVDEGRHWRSLAPVDTPPRTHGWKIHVSATIASYTRALEVASRICFDLHTPLKYVARWSEVQGALSKNAVRTSAGKLIVIYPQDDDVLGHIANCLDQELGGAPGPYILGDVRLRSGPVYFRYGGFMPLVIPDDSGPTLSYPDAKGTLVPDVREPVFRRPPGRHPAVVEEAISALDAAGGLGPLAKYASIEPKQFSAAGGIYVATNQDGLRSILKEARPDAGLDAAGRLAPARLHQEYSNLQRLEDLGFVPHVYRRFRAGEHDFLELEYIEGCTFLERTSRSCPGLDPTVDSEGRRSYAESTLRLLRILADHVAALHNLGLVVGDLHPGNILVTPNGDVVLIDLEDGRAPGSCDPGPFNALGYAPPEGFTAAEADWFALSRVAVSAFEPAFAKEILAPQLWPRIKEHVVAPYGVEVMSFIDELELKFPCAEGSRLLRPVAVPTPASCLPHVTHWQVAESLANSLLSCRSSAAKGDPLATSTLRRTCFGTGLAGIATGLHRAGMEVPGDILSGLEAAHLAPGAELGLFDGLAGIAATLDELGHRDATSESNSVIRRCAGRVRSLGFATGLSGLAVQQLDHDVDFALDLARRATSLSETGPGERSLQRTPGLFHGWAGLSLAQALVGVAARDQPLIEAALSSLEMDRRNRRDSSPGVAGLGERGGRRTFPYLENGSAGFLVAFSALRSNGLIENAAAWEGDLEAFTTACSGELYAFEGLFRGRAGILMGLLAVSAWCDVEAVMLEHALALRRNLLSWNGGTFCFGDHLLRLSMDVSTGSAGAALAFLSLHKRAPQWLPGSLSGRVGPSEERG